MAKTDSRFSSDLIRILMKATENKIYGSVEVYFEAGRVTQVTQRIINKIKPKIDKKDDKEVVRPLT